MNIILNIPEKLHSDITNYCELNNLDVSEFINQMIKKGFMVEKFGDTPFANFNVSEPEVKTEDNTIEEKKTIGNNEQIEDKSTVAESNVKIEQVVKTNSKRRLK